VALSYIICEIKIDIGRKSRFLPISRYISQTIQDSAIVIIEGE